MVGKIDIGSQKVKDEMMYEYEENWRGGVVTIMF